MPATFKKVYSLYICFCLFFPLFNTSLAEDKICTLPAHKIIRIGCSDGCQKKNREAILEVALAKNYKVDFFPLNRFNSHKTDKHFLDKVDLLLFEGGVDIQSKYYSYLYPKDKWDKTCETYINPSLNKNSKKMGGQRDDLEFHLLQNYFQNAQLSHLPALGICRGMQMMSIASGLPLYYDLEKQLGIKAPRNVNQAVEIQNKSYIVWENHHQGLHLDYFKNHQTEFPDIHIVGSSYNSQVVEMMEWQNRPAKAVQFHPEYSSLEMKMNIFGWALEASCRKKMAGF